RECAKNSWALSKYHSKYTVRSNLVLRENLFPRSPREMYDSLISCVRSMPPYVVRCRSGEFSTSAFIDKSKMHTAWQRSELLHSTDKSINIGVSSRFPGMYVR